MALNFRKASLDLSFDLPGVTVLAVHSLKTVFIYDADPNMPDERYEALEKHLKKQGYFLQVIVGPRTIRNVMPPGDGNGNEA